MRPPWVGRRATPAPVRIGSREVGSASVLLMAVMGVVVLLAYGALVVGGYALAYHRARGAADLAAVSGAAAYGLGQEACAAARRVAADNGARIAHCDVAGDQIEFVVSVRVALPVELRVHGLPRQVEAAASAGSVG